MRVCAAKADPGNTGSIVFEQYVVAMGKMRKDQEEAAHSPLLVLRELAAMAYYGAIRGWLGPLQRVI